MLRLLFPDARAVYRPAAKATHVRKVVLVLGWGGSKQRNLRRLLDYYDSRAVDSLSFIMPMGVPQFLRDYYERQVAAELAQRGVESLHAVHSYSNNGAWVYASLCQKANDETLRPWLRLALPPVRRVVLDSAPSSEFFSAEHPSALREARLYVPVVTSVLLQRAQYQHWWVSPLALAALVPAMLLSRAMQRLQAALPALGLRLVPDLPALHRYLRDKTPSVPTLLMYTSGDRLVPPNMVRSRP